MDGPSPVVALETVRRVSTCLAVVGALVVHDLWPRILLPVYPPGAELLMYGEARGYAGSFVGVLVGLGLLGLAAYLRLVALVAGRPRTGVPARVADGTLEERGAAVA